MLTIDIPTDEKQDVEEESADVVISVHNTHRLAYTTHKQLLHNKSRGITLFEAMWSGKTDHNIQHGDSVIVKRCPVSNQSKRETTILRLLMSDKNPYHDFFPKLLSCKRVSSNYVDIVLEHAGVDFHTYFFKDQDWDDCQETAMNHRIAKTTKTLAKAMTCLVKLHALGISHGDIKPDNFVIEPIMQHVRLIDFESAIDKQQPDEQSPIRPFFTPMYSHPFVCAGMPISGFVADMWAFGQMTFGLYVGRSFLDTTCTSERHLRQSAFFHQHNWACTYKHLFPQALLSHPTFTDFVDFVNLLCGDNNTQRPARADMMLLQHPFLCAWRTKPPF